MARRINSEVRIRELLEELAGCNDLGHCSALVRLRKVLEQQKEALPSKLRRDVIQALRLFIRPFGGCISTPAEAVRCLGTNVLWDRSQAKWLDAQRQKFKAPSLLPVHEAINAVFVQQRQRRNHVIDMIHEFKDFVVE